MVSKADGKGTTLALTELAAVRIGLAEIDADFSCLYGQVKPRLHVFF